MKKTIMAILLALLMCFAFAGCGGNSDGNNEGNDSGVTGEGYKVTFNCDEHVKVYVYKTQDMSGEGEETTIAYSRDANSGDLLDDGNGQVNFKLVFSDGYKLADIDITEGYNNLKGSADTGVENGYRITKITDDLTVTITSQQEGTTEDLSQGYKVTFVCDEHVSVLVYKTQDMTSGGEKTNTAYSRESSTGTLTKTDGQVNFTLVFDDGYELAGIDITEGYKNLKKPDETGVENGYRITKIENDLTVTVTSKEAGAEEDYSQGYEITFVCSEHVSVIVYKTQALSDGEQTNTAYSRDGDFGTLLKDGNGQVNFRLVCDEGYEVLADNIVISGEYKQLKDQGNDVYRITKIEGDLIVTVTATAKS